MIMSKTSDVYKLFIGFVLFLCATVGIMIYANNQNYVRVDYNNINEFLQNKNNISFYEMYDAYAYIIEGKKELISQSDMTFSHQYTHTDKYHIEDNMIYFSTTDQLYSYTFMILPVRLYN